MNILRTFFCGALLLSASTIIAQEKSKAAPATAAEDTAVASIRSSSEKLVAAFNAEKSDDLAAMFLPKGELIDEEGTVYQGERKSKRCSGRFSRNFRGRNCRSTSSRSELLVPWRSKKELG